MGLEQRRTKEAQGWLGYVRNYWSRRRRACRTAYCYHLVANYTRSLDKWQWKVILGATIFWILTFFYFIPTLLSVFVPFEYFTTVNRVWVDSIEVGEPLIIKVDRVNHRTYVATSYVDLRKEYSLGFGSYCHRSLEGLTHEERSALPDPMTFNWWFGIPPNIECPKLVPGTYYIATTRTIDWWFGAKIKKTFVSNTFKVYDKGMKPTGATNITAEDIVRQLRAQQNSGKPSTIVIIPGQANPSSSPIVNGDE